jgi:hypothetical protein
MLCPSSDYPEYCDLITDQQTDKHSGLRRGSKAARLFALRVRTPPEAWVSVSCECCMLSGRGLCDGPIPRPEESYRLWCVAVCDLKPSRMRQPCAALGCCARGKTEQTVWELRNIQIMVSQLWTLKIINGCGHETMAYFRGLVSEGVGINSLADTVGEPSL